MLDARVLRCYARNMFKTLMHWLFDPLEPVPVEDVLPHDLPQYQLNRYRKDN